MSANRFHRVLLAVIALLVCAGARGDDAVRRAPQLDFATVEQGRAMLTRRDDFVQRLSAFDRSARLARTDAVSEADYLAFVAASVRAWSTDERAAVEAAYATLRPAIDALGLTWPASISMIRTTGEEEGGAAYTRGDAVVLPPSVLETTARSALARILAHELFHVLSRDAASLKERAYAAIGFVPCTEVALPPALRERRITNPDAPRNDHCIAVEADGARTYGVPIIYARAPFDAARNEPFFAYLELRLLLVGRSASGQATYDEAHPRLARLDEVKGFFEQVGRNTRYVIHPEEILADNFALIVTHAQDAASPDVLARIEAALRAPR